MKASSLIGPIGILAVGVTIALGVGTYLHVQDPVRVFDQQLLTAGVTNVISGSAPSGYGRTDATNVDCPVDVPVEAGKTFRCSVQLAGSATSVDVVVIGDDETAATGGPASGQYTVAFPLEPAAAGSQPGSALEGSPPQGVQHTHPG
jgi:hypothetical protein